MKTGFARLDITPPFGTSITGYFDNRIADGILDPLQVHAITVCDGERLAAILCLDLIGIRQEEMDRIRRRVAEQHHIPYEAVFVACTHTHTGPEVASERWFPCDPHYNEYLFCRISDAVALALRDLRESKVEIARAEAKGISFIRRFRMKDGSVLTNPGVGNPEIDHPIGTPDEGVQLIKIVRENAPDIAIVHFQVHPDVIGGSRFSADYPGFVRRTLEDALRGEKDGVHVVYFNGAQGDTNHICVKNAPITRGYDHARHMGRVIAGTVLSVYDQTLPVADGPIVGGQRTIRVPANKGSAEEVAWAKAQHKLFDEDRAAYQRQCNEGMAMGKVKRLMEMEGVPDWHELYVTAVGFGGIVFAGLPGEPFTDIGRAIKAQSPFAMTLPCCCANGYQGYFPMREAFEEGGYEAGASPFQAGVAEALVDASAALLHELKMD